MPCTFRSSCKLFPGWRSLRTWLVPFLQYTLPCCCKNKAMMKYNTCNAWLYSKYTMEHCNRVLVIVHTPGHSQIGLSHARSQILHSSSCQGSGQVPGKSSWNCSVKNHRTKTRSALPMASLLRIDCSWIWSRWLIQSVLEVLIQSVVYFCWR